LAKRAAGEWKLSEAIVPIIGSQNQDSAFHAGVESMAGFRSRHDRLGTAEDAG